MYKGPNAPQSTRTALRKLASQYIYTDVNTQRKATLRKNPS
jgi:hypothetical protein